MNTNLQNSLSNAGNRPTVSLIDSQDLTGRLNLVKQEVFAEYRTALGANDQLLRLAIIEADALARQTEYPHLVFPLLASEKANSAARWQYHQQFRLRSDYALSA